MTVEIPSRNLRVTIDQIASEAQVGRTTVADIVNRGAGHKYKITTRDRVLETAKRLGYVPSGLAQAIARGRSGQVGLMLTRDFKNPYWGRLAAAVEAGLRRRGMYMQLAITDGDVSREHDLVRHLYGQHIEGLLVGPVYEDEQVQRHQEVFGGLIPIVAFGGPIPGFDVVGVDHGAGRRLAVEYLISLGHRRIGYLCLPDRGGVHGDGLNITAFRTAVRTGGIFDPRWVIPQWTEFSHEDHQQTINDFATDWLATAIDERPTAMLCNDDRVAMNTLLVLHRRGIRVPQDISLVGFDNLPESQLFIPPLTTIDAHVDQQMEQGLLMLLDEPSLPGSTPRSRLLTPTLIKRESTRAISGSGS